jgi:hypothetical protein
VRDTKTVSATIDIFGQPCKVSARKTGKTTWRAIGFYNDTCVEGDGAGSPDGAFERWREKAEAATNDSGTGGHNEAENTL